MSGYRKASLVVLIVLVAMAVWVASGHGFPGGSVYRRTTGHDGPTGGLTTAMRAMLRGDFAGGAARHASAPFVFAFLVAQLVWRTIVIGGCPRLPERTWVYDLAASFTLFAASIYLPLA